MDTDVCDAHFDGVIGLPPAPQATSWISGFHGHFRSRHRSAARLLSQQRGRHHLKSKENVSSGEKIGKYWGMRALHTVAAMTIGHPPDEREGPHDTGRWTPPSPPTAQVSLKVGARRGAGGLW